MSSYVREKVLRIPRHKIDFAKIVHKLEEKYPDDNVMDDLEFYLEQSFPDVFNYHKKLHFKLSPTVSPFFDLLIDHEWDCDGEWGKVRELYESEKEIFLPYFQKIDSNIDMNDVRVVEYCWYNCSEAPDYYSITNDPFYKEITI